MAEVKDEFTCNTHYLIFLIPKGDKGDIGPQGLVGTAILDSYASLYEDNGNSYMLVANTPKQVEFSKNSQIKNIIILNSHIENFNFINLQRRNNYERKIKKF